jgi:hypothetical protein
MLGNVGRHRRWPWVILFFLFALTFAWSFGVMGEEVGDVWSILRIGSAAGSALSLLLLVLASFSNRRRRRAERDQGSEVGADQEEQEEQLPTVPTYEEVFGLELDLDEGSLPRAPEDVEWTGDDEAELEAEAQPWAEQRPAEEGALSEEDGQALDADLDEAVDQVDQVDALADGDPQEQLRRMREEFKARAEEAALRVKQREAELHGAGSAPDPKR